MTDLKPCLFCGEKYLIDYGIMGGTMEGFDYVQCANCGAEIHAVHNGNHIEAVEAWNRRAESVKDQPDGDVVEVRHGKWDYEISDVGWTDYSCSVCRNIITVEGQDEDLYSYCPYCGAKMDGKVGADNA